MCACADCHMQYTRVGANKISNHDVGSPLRHGMKACQQCHSESADWLKAQVIAIQDRTIFAPEPGRLRHGGGGQAL